MLMAVKKMEAWLLEFQKEAKILSENSNDILKNQKVKSLLGQLMAGIEESDVIKTRMSSLRQNF